MVDLRVLLEVPAIVCRGGLLLAGRRAPPVFGALPPFRVEIKNTF
jgi:hypothetical protein